MGDLLHALHAHQPLPRGSYPTAKWPEGCTHLPAATVKESLTVADKYAPPPLHADHTRIDFASSYLDGETVTADVEIDREPMHYQHGTIRGTVEVCGLYVRGFNFGMYCSPSALLALTFEAEAEVWRRVDRGLL